MAIRKSKEEDIPYIKAIWKEVFTQDEEYLNFVFSNLFPIADSFVYCQKKRPISSLFILPLSCNIYNYSNSSVFLINNRGIPRKVKGGYLYGVCTAKKHQGCGFSTALINYIISYYSGKLDFIITHPAEKSLFEFYYKRGFNIQIPKHRFFGATISPYNNKISPCKNTTQSTKISKTTEQLSHLLNSSKISCFIWDNIRLAYIIKELWAEDKIIVFINSNKYSAAFVQPFYYAPNITHSENFMLLINLRQEVLPYQHSIFMFPME